MSKKSWYAINAKGPTPEIIIYEEIGIWGISAADFHGDLRALGDLHGKDLDVRLNTPGGDVFAGNAMYNMLLETGAKVHVFVDGVAASMGSLIAMVGEPVSIAANAMLMIHNPAAFEGGDSKVLRRTAQLLDSLREGMVTAYVKKSGLGRDEVSAMMDEETWMTAEDAVAYGFADKITEAKQVHAVDLSKFKHPPKLAGKTAPRRSSKEVHEMDKSEVETMIAAANAPILEALAKLATPTPKAKAEGEDERETPEQIIARANAERDTYEGDVRALCEDFDSAEKAGDFIKDKKSLADVRAALRLAKADKAKKSVTGRNHVPEGKAGDEDGADDLVVNKINHRGIWAKWNSTGGDIQRVTPKDAN